MKEKSNKTEVKKTPGKVRKKIQRNVPTGIAHVQSTFNNTIISITDLAGHVISWSSAGRSGYSGSRKSSGFAATVAAQNAAKAAGVQGMKEVEIRLKGAGGGRESAVRGILSGGLIVTKISDYTPTLFNGCKPRKRRRV